jgi:hypothetical protein
MRPSLALTMLGHARAVSAQQGEPSQHVARAIYGQILVTSVVAALSEDKAASAREILGGVVITTLVFWLAHVYSAAAAAQLGHRHHLSWPELRGEMRSEWPIVEAAFPTAAILALGWTGVLSTDAATNLAIGVGVTGLIGLGFQIGRRSGLTRLGTALAVALSGAFGIAIVALKVLVH